jgi:ABC-type Fe3+/spermidine/putrescine transport system ATPase subunit
VSPAVLVRGLEVRSGAARLLGPLDLAVEEGEHVLLVGPSGSGKTTLLRALAGLVAPAAGTLELFGARASSPGKVDLCPERRGVGMLFQGGGLWPHMSVARTLRFALSAAGVPRGARPARVRELLERVELIGFDERLPGTLSGGEAQRLALARALAASPRLLLLDEPLGPLDAELRGSLLGMLANLHRDLGWTAIHVTHDPAEAARVATRTVRLEQGRLVAPAPARA